jgi:4-amino-4-deoxy-L-arabinose transferase-like glycosyltransferase
MFRFYDDELHNLILVSDRNFKEIIDYTSEYDFHPPIQYLVNKISLQLFGLNEFWLSLPSIIFIAIAVILSSRLVFKLTGSLRFSLACGLIIASNPLILLWGSSIRWYPLWTFLAVLSIHLVIILLAEQKKSKRILLISALIITLALSLYTNYQTIILITSFLITVLVLDLNNKERKYFDLKVLVPVIIGVTILFAPYLTVFINHVEAFFLRKEIYSGYNSTSPLLSGGYFLFSVLFGNSIYPWDTRFVIIIIIALAAGLWSLIYCKTHSFSLLKTVLHTLIPQEKKKVIFFLIVLIFTLFSLFLIQSIISGVAVTRGLLILPMLIVIVTSAVLYYLFRTKYRKLSFLVSVGIISFFFIWLIGSYNVIMKKSLHKAGLMDPVEEVTLLVQKTSSTSLNNFIIVTYDPILSYYLAKSELFERSTIFSPYKNEIGRLLTSVNNSTNLKGLNFDPKATLIFIESYPGTLIPLKERLDSLKHYIFKEGTEIKSPIKLGFDPEAIMKRRFFPSAEIIDWRYTIYSLHPKTSWDEKTLGEMNTVKVY